MNSVNLIGRLTVDPELRTTATGISVCTSQLAVDRPGCQDTTDYLNIVAWRQTAEFISRNIVKGERIGVSGVLTSRSYTDKEGHKRTAFEVVVNRVYFADGGRACKAAAPPPTAREAIDEIIDNDTLPF